MRKQEVVIHIPGLNDKRRFSIPDNMRIRQCIHLMVMLIEEEYPNLIVAEDKLHLYKVSTGEMLNNESCLGLSDIRLDDELVLG